MNIMIPGFSAKSSLTAHYCNIFDRPVDDVDRSTKIIPQAPPCFVCGRLNMGCKRRCHGNKECLEDCIPDVNDCFSDCTGISVDAPPGCTNPHFQVVCPGGNQEFCHPELFC